MNNDKPCSVDGCDRPVKVLGWCKGHYQRVQRDGDPGSATFRRSPGKVSLKELARKSEPEQCAIEGCDNPARGRGWCNRHYQNWYRTGVNPSLGDLRQYKVLETCSADGCARAHQTRGFCDMHYRRRRRGLDPSSPDSLSQPPAFNDNSYAAIHRRLAAERGAARERVCACGEPAEQWAYQHNDSASLTSHLGHPYSLRIYDCYEAMCLSCHGRLDKGRLRSPK